MDVKVNSDGVVVVDDEGGTARYFDQSECLRDDDDFNSVYFDAAGSVPNVSMTSSGSSPPTIDGDRINYGKKNGDSPIPSHVGALVVFRAGGEKEKETEEEEDSMIRQGVCYYQGMEMEIDKEKEKKGEWEGGTEGGGEGRWGRKAESGRRAPRGLGVPSERNFDGSSQTPPASGGTSTTAAVVDPPELQAPLPSSLCNAYLPVRAGSTRAAMALSEYDKAYKAALSEIGAANDWTVVARTRRQLSLLSTLSSSSTGRPSSGTEMTPSSPSLSNDLESTSIVATPGKPVTEGGTSSFGPDHPNPLASGGTTAAVAAVDPPELQAPLPSSLCNAYLPVIAVSTRAATALSEYEKAYTAALSEIGAANDGSLVERTRRRLSSFSTATALSEYEKAYKAALSEIGSANDGKLVARTRRRKSSLSTLSTTETTPSSPSLSNVLESTFLRFVDEHFGGMPSPPLNPGEFRGHSEGFVKTRGGTRRVNRRLSEMSRRLGGSGEQLDRTCRETRRHSEMSRRLGGSGEHSNGTRRVNRRHSEKSRRYEGSGEQRDETRRVTRRLSKTSLQSSASGRLSRVGTEVIVVGTRPRLGTQTEGASHRDSKLETTRVDVGGHLRRSGSPGKQDWTRRGTRSTSAGSRDSLPSSDIQDMASVCSKRSSNSARSNRGNRSRRDRSIGSRSYQQEGDRCISSRYSDADGTKDDDDNSTIDSAGTKKSLPRKGFLRQIKQLASKVKNTLGELGGLHGVHKFQLGERARYKTLKIRDKNLMIAEGKYDVETKTVAVKVIAEHIDAVLKAPYYTILLPDGSRKQTNWDSLMTLSEYRKIKSAAVSSIGNGGKDDDPVLRSGSRIRSIFGFSSRSRGGRIDFAQSQSCSSRREREQESERERSSRSRGHINSTRSRSCSSRRGREQESERERSTSRQSRRSRSGQRRNSRCRSSSNGHGGDDEDDSACKLSRQTSRSRSTHGYDSTHHCRQSRRSRSGQRRNSICRSSSNGHGGEDDSACKLSRQTSRSRSTHGYDSTHRDGGGSIKVCSNSDGNRSHRARPRSQNPFPRRHELEQVGDRHDRRSGSTKKHQHLSRPQPCAKSEGAAFHDKKSPDSISRWTKYERQVSGYCSKYS